MARRNRLSPWIALFATLAIADPVLAADGAPDTGLASCSALIDRDPERALAFADDWEKRGGAGAARLCRATALFKKGDFARAGDIYEALAVERGGADARAATELLTRAGWARSRAGRSADAERLYTAALEKTPNSPDLRVDRAIARAESGRPVEAVEDLDAVLAGDPDRVDALLLRGAASRSLKRWDAAAADAAHLLKLHPDDPDALLLAGNVKAGRGDLGGAAGDWRTIVRVAPGSRAAVAAANNLKHLEVGDDRRAPAPPPPADPVKRILPEVKPKR